MIDIEIRALERLIDRVAGDLKYTNRYVMEDELLTNDGQAILKAIQRRVLLLEKELDKLKHQRDLDLRGN